MADKNSETYLRILGYFQSHLCATSKEAAEALKLNHSTVNRYVRLIRQDWRQPAPMLLDPVAIEMRVRNLERVLGKILEMEA